MWGGTGGDPLGASGQDRPRILSEVKPAVVDPNIIDISSTLSTSMSRMTRVATDVT